LLRRADGAGSAERSEREPDSDFSSLPIEPPALPDCAKVHGAARVRRSEARASVRVTAFVMGKKSKNQRISASGAVSADRSDNAASFASLADR
jgi:hypothetical protein